MQEQFENWLKSKGYTEKSASGNKTTIYKYLHSIDIVLGLECYTWEELAQNIDSIIGKYDRGGPEADVGELSKRTVINALKRFQEFVRDTQK